MSRFSPNPLEIPMKKQLLAALLLIMFCSAAFAADIEATAIKAPSHPGITIVTIEASGSYSVVPCTEDDEEEIASIHTNGYRWFIHGRKGAEFWLVFKDDIVQFRIGDGSVRQMD